MGELGKNRRISIEKNLRRIPRIDNKYREINVYKKEEKIKNQEESVDTKKFYEIFNKGNKKIFENIDLPKLTFYNEKSDILVVIPIRKRINQLETSLYFLNKEKKKTDISIKIVVVEHDENDECRDLVNSLGYDYIHIKSKGEIFNKCLCHNIGSLIIDSKYILFHDSDLIVPDNFFNNLMKNIKNKGNKAAQCFNGRRVIYMDEVISNKVKLTKNIRDVARNSLNLKEGKYGAPGGSIIIEREIFNEIGGFDPQFFYGYSVEDAFFWEKMKNLTDITVCSDPLIEMYHIWHEPNYRSNPRIHIDHQIFNLFKSFTDHQKKNFFTESKKELEKLKSYVS